MIVVIIAPKQDAMDVAHLLFSAQKEKYVRYNFRDAKAAIKCIMGGLRIASDKKYLPFFKIVENIERSEKRVLIDDCDSEQRLMALRGRDAKIIHVGSADFYMDGDLYIENKPKGLRELTQMIERIDHYLNRKVGLTIERGEGWVLYKDDAFEQN